MDYTNDQPRSGEAVPQATPSRWRPLPKPTCRKERAGLAREGLRGGGRGVLPPPRVHWLQSCRVGPTRPVIGCETDTLHTGRGKWARLGPALGVRVATAATEVDSRAGHGPVPGSQVKQEGYKVGGWGSTSRLPFSGAMGIGRDKRGVALLSKLEGTGAGTESATPSTCPPARAVLPGSGQPLPTAHCVAPDPLCV